MTIDSAGRGRRCCMEEAGGGVQKKGAFLWDAKYRVNDAENDSHLQASNEADCVSLLWRG